MDKKPRKNPKKYYCEKCDFTSKNKKDFNRHLSTRKHQMDNKDKKWITKKNPIIYSYECTVCGKKYKYASGLSKHKKKCLAPKVEENSENVTIEISSTYVDKNEVEAENESLKQEVAELKIMMKQILNNQDKNQEQNKVRDEYLKDIIPKIGNTYNNAMSINIYLNEKCKDAMNLTDFVENVKVSLEDLLYTKNHGFVKGISNIFVKQLQDMEPTQRPIHCSDKKRLQFYVKDADKWEKDKSHEKIDKTIDEITFKQIKQVKLWEKQHPNYLEDDKLLIEWQTMIRNMTTGTNSNITMEKEKSSIKKELGMTVEVAPEIRQLKLEAANELIDKKI